MTPARPGALPKSPRRRLALAASAAAVLLVGANIAHRAIHGHGHWHQLAQGLYHVFKPVPVQAAALVTERGRRADDHLRRPVR